MTSHDCHMTSHDCHMTSHDCHDVLDKVFQKTSTDELTV